MTNITEQDIRDLDARSIIITGRGDNEYAEVVIDGISCKTKEELDTLKTSEVKAKEILTALGSKDKQDAIIDQINLIQEALATGDNTKVIAVRDTIQKILTT